MNFVHALRGVTLANEGKAEGQQEKRILVRDEVRRDEVRRAAMMMVASCCFLFTTKFALTDPSLCQVSLVGHQHVYFATHLQSALPAELRFWRPKAC